MTILTSKVVAIYEHGNYIGSAEIEFDDAKNPLMLVYEISGLGSVNKDEPELTDADEPINILYLSDMHYGLVIDKETSDRLREAIS